MGECERLKIPHKWTMPANASSGWIRAPEGHSATIYESARRLTGGIDRSKQAIRLEEKAFHTAYTLLAGCLPVSWRSLPLCGIFWMIIDGQHSNRSEYRN